MSDIRENILSRLFDIARGVDSGAMRMEVDFNNLPCLALVDGEEEFLGRVAEHEVQAPGTMLMTPHFALVIETSAAAGPQLSSTRSKLIKAVCNDATIRNLTGIKHGRNSIGAQYMGNDTNLQLGEGLIAAMILHFAIPYSFTPADL